jgi:hypothetical protein
MKKILLFIFIPVFSFGDIIFPESLYLIHRETGYKILVGTPPEFIEKFFGPPKKKVLQFKFHSPDYEIWDMFYEAFEIRYQTYSMMVTSITITITTNAFCTSEGLTVGTPLTEVIKSYGNPMYITTNQAGELI